MPKGIYERTPEILAGLRTLRRGREVACPVCGAVKYKTAAQLRKLTDTETGYCSRSCRAKANAAHLLPYCANGKGKTRPGTGLSGEMNPSWKGGVTFKRNKGNYIGPKYVRCPADLMEMARKDGYVMEHRLVMARMIGRPLTRAEAVHHIDHNTRNNAPENLMLFATNAEHKRYEGEIMRASLAAIATEAKP